MRLYNSPRPCVGGCGTLIEWGLDAERRVGLIESNSREAHLCPKRLTGAYIECACGAIVHHYADGAVEDARSRLPHECRRAATPAATNRVAAPPLPAPEPPRRSLNDALGVG